MGGRILICKVGLDGHEAGAKLITAILRDAGHEVIYTGMRRTVQDIVRIALEEDVDLIGISLLSGAHMTVCQELKATLESQGLADTPVLVGGIIPDSDHGALTALGVRGVFTPGATSETIVGLVEELVSESQRRKQLA